MLISFFLFTHVKLKQIIKLYFQNDHHEKDVIYINVIQYLLQVKQFNLFLDL